MIVGFAALPSPVLKFSTGFAVESFTAAAALAEPDKAVVLAAVIPKPAVHAHGFGIFVESYDRCDGFKVHIDRCVLM